MHHRACYTNCSFKQLFLRTNFIKTMRLRFAEFRIHNIFWTGTVILWLWIRTALTENIWLWICQQNKNYETSWPESKCFVKLSTSSVSIDNHFFYKEEHKKEQSGCQVVNTGTARWSHSSGFCSGFCRRGGYCNISAWLPAKWFATITRTWAGGVHYRYAVVHIAREAPPRCHSKVLSGTTG